MSTGDGDSLKWHVDLNALLAQPLIKHFYERPYRVDRWSWDCPYLAGYTYDAKIIIIDRDMPDGFWNGRTYVTTDQYLVLHEHVEKTLIDAYRAWLDHHMDTTRIPEFQKYFTLDNLYLPAHHVATTAEEYAVRLAGIPLDAYNEFMAKHVKTAESENLRAIAPDYDLTPLKQAGGAQALALLAKVRRLM